MIIPIIGGLLALVGIGVAVKSVLKTTPAVPPGFTPSNNLTTAVITAPSDLVPVKLGNETWLVAPDYIGPIGINEAANMAKAMGMELPSPALVDAIWRQADLKLLPMPRNNVISQAVFDDQKRKISEQIAGRPFTLMGGAFKDVVQVGGHPEIYGWHVEDGKSVAGVPLLKPFTAGPGKIIQPPSGSRHNQTGPVGFKDYSQGFRPVKRAS